MYTEGVDRGLVYGRFTSAEVGVAPGYGLEDREVGVRILVGSRILSSPCRLDRLWGLQQPHIQCVPGVLSPGVKRQGREAGHSPPVNVEVKKTWIYTFTSSYAFMA
jgi:hypothetical protein